MLLACLLTVAIETAVFFLAGYREPRQLQTAALVNAISNLSLNVLLALAWSCFRLRLADPRAPAIYLLEAGVVLFEYLIYTKACRPGARLFFVCLLANLLSYLAGRLVF